MGDRGGEYAMVREKDRGREVEYAESERGRTLWKKEKEIEGEYATLRGREQWDRSIRERFW